MLRETHLGWLLGHALVCGPAALAVLTHTEETQVLGILNEETRHNWGIAEGQRTDGETTMRRKGGDAK